MCSTTDYTGSIIKKPQNVFKTNSFLFYFTESLNIISSFWNCHLGLCHYIFQTLNNNFCCVIVNHSSSYISPPGNTFCNKHVYEY